MARIYKAHQFKIDKENKVVIPAFEPPPPSEKDGEIEAEKILKEFSADKLVIQQTQQQDITQQMQSKQSQQFSQTQQSQSKITSVSEQNQISQQSVHQKKFETIENILSAQPSTAFESGALSVLKRKALELVATEQRLKEIEQSLIQREIAVFKQEENLHKELLERRKLAEEEIRKQLDMARQTAENIISSAKAEAEAIKKAAVAEIEAIKQKAYKEGFALGEEKGIIAGEKAGREEILLDWQALMQETELIISELQTSRMAILKASEEEMLKLVISFAKKILKVEPLARPEIILNNLDAAINKISEVDKIVIRINLKDKTMTESHKQELLNKLQGIKDVQIIEDATLAPGGVKIETGVSTIDATIESQAQELETQLLKYFQQNKIEK